MVFGIPSSVFKPPLYSLLQYGALNAELGSSASKSRPNLFLSKKKKKKKKIFSAGYLQQGCQPLVVSLITCTGHGQNVTSLK